ncbi:helix-turn-helix domain-containing protein [Mycobacteroides abscessus]|uniref:helix-turn-helix domain-containing protein n=1 Tax=Mycobacteroides abscessus TaxID=36809 RepID=UPI0009A58A7B|nr:helix-turn-helix domain-containing protein [Mycobacteroides abscessus]UVK63427.1 excise [Mycobacterium phage Baudelaire]WKW86537.1 excise [Mycobacterium phage Aegeus]SKT46704.1 Uncharacterised protein [Mycobacteroides abscessus subsp. bolletii]
MTLVQAVTAEPVLVPRLQAAEMIGLSPREFDDVRRAGKIFTKQYGRKILVPMDELKKFAESLPWDKV